MRVSNNGVALLKRFEGLELEAYQDIAGIWTIGYGHTGPDVQPGMKISEREAEEILKRDLKPREEAVARLVAVPLNQNEFDALVSFVYNVGIEAFKGSTARRRLNAKDRVGAAEALTWWNKATVGGVLRVVTGLTRRRAAERALFLEPVAPPVNTANDNLAENSRITPVEDAPRRPNLAESRSVQGATVAGGAGVAASNMGRDSAEHLDQLETNIESGESLTESADDGFVPSSGGAADAPSTDGGGQSAEEAPADGVADGASAGGETTTGDGGASDAPVAVDDGDNVSITDGVGESFETVEVGGDRPAKHEKHAADAQIQFALQILIIIAVLYIIFARVDDWFRYRR